VVTSGQVGVVTGERGPELVPGGTAAELTQALANQVWTAAFGDHRPARTAVAVAALPLGARAEVAAWAWVGSNA
jgi:enamine deaminase RidA (YjgF/YER057c/UK114 family)